MASCGEMMLIPRASVARMWPGMLPAEIMAAARKKLREMVVVVDLLEVDRGSVGLSSVIDDGAIWDECG